jgi:hypothetical protein
MRGEINAFHFLPATLSKHFIVYAATSCVRGAGKGKTVILKNLYYALVSREIPVPGLIGDKLYASSISELQEKISPPIPVFNFVEQCITKGRNYKKLIKFIE